MFNVVLGIFANDEHDYSRLHIFRSYLLEYLDHVGFWFITHSAAMLTKCRTLSTKMMLVKFPERMGVYLAQIKECMK